MASTSIIQLLRTEIPQHLFAAMQQVEPYPQGVQAVVAMVPGTAFFPGGMGLWCEEMTDIIPDVMVLANDFSTLTEYEKMLSGAERDIESPTWVNLAALAHRAGLDLKRCFFTNAFMGLRNQGTSTDKNPAHKDKLFRQRNVDFLRFQISVIKPHLIITLGRPSREMLSMTSGELECWNDANFKDIDREGKALLQHVRIDEHVVTCIALLHTSFRGSNLHNRSYRGLVKDPAEVQLLKDALGQ